MANYSADTRMKELQKKRDELMKVSSRELPQLDLSEGNSNKVLDLLDDSESMDAMLYGVQLENQVKSNALHGVFPTMEWFESLNLAQRSQVIDYLNSLLDKYGLMLVWFSRGSQRGYMFDRLSSPVASR